MTALAHRTTRTAPRRVGYLIAALVDVVALFLINIAPGWRAVPVLTEDAGAVVVTANIVLVIALAFNVMCLLRPRRALARLSDVVTTAGGLVALAHLRMAFPFSFGDGAADWSGVAKTALTVAIVIVAITLLVQLVMLARAVSTPERHTDHAAA
ncbi:hypothetical protein ACTG9Q_22780 [Actinokineospora sp. 24-640]